MSTEQDILAGRINAAIEEWDAMPAGQGAAHVATHVAAALTAAGYTKPRQVTTDTDLDSLPDGVLILTEQGGYWESIKRMDGKNWWKEPGKTDVSPSEDLTLPATVLYSPAAS